MLKRYTGSHRFSRHALLACSILLGTAQVSNAQSASQFAPYPKKAADDSELLGGWLEERFSRMVDTCTDAKWDRKVRRFASSAAAVTVVPNRLSTRFSLSRKADETEQDGHVSRIFDLGSQSLPALFANVRSNMPAGRAQIDGNLLPVGPGTAALNFSGMSPELRLVSPHFNGSSYSAACTTSISYAYNLSGGYEMPAAAVKAALAGSNSDTASNSLRIVEGVFYSPFAAMWRGTYADYSEASNATSIRSLPTDAIEPLKTHVSLIFWRWYTENAGRADHDNGILEYFSGIAVREENQAASKRDAEVSGEFSASLPVLSVSMKGKAGFNSTSSFWSDSFFLASFRDGRSRHVGSSYMRLPTPAQISKHFEGLRLSPWNESDTFTVYNADVVAFSQYIHGVTAPHCTTAKWRAKAVDGNAPPPQGLTLVRVEQALDSQQVPICLASFTYKPSAADVSNGATLQFALAYDETVTSKGADVQLRLASAPVTLKSYGRPDWRKLTVQAAVPIDPSNVAIPVGTVGAKHEQLRWKFEYQFDSKGTSGQPVAGSLVLENDQVRCSGGETPTVIKATPSLENRGVLGPVLVVTLDAGVSEGMAVIAPAASPKCQFSATVRYRLNVSGSPEIKTPLLTAELFFPLELQAAAAK